MRGVWILMGLAACEPENADVGPVTDLNERPDIQGAYTVAVTDLDGCEGTVDLDLLVGDLTIAGPATELVYTFPGVVLDGSVDAAFTFEATGTADRSDHALDFTLEGLAFIGDETWNLDGDLTVDRIDSTAQTVTCTLTALLEAEQTP